MKYEMTQPCNLCPFRNDDKRLTVDPDRLREFARGEFVCHQTAEYRDCDDEDSFEASGYYGTAESQHCAGALIFHENREYPHLMMRIAAQCGKYNSSKLKMDSPVFKNWKEVYEADGRGDEVG
jgi:hypothetical protein